MKRVCSWSVFQYFSFKSISPGKSVITAAKWQALPPESAPAMRHSALRHARDIFSEAAGLPDILKIYGRLGVRTIINASGPSTRLSGGIMLPEVAQAMAEASTWCSLTTKTKSRRVRPGMKRLFATPGKHDTALAEETQSRAMISDGRQRKTHRNSDPGNDVKAHSGNSLGNGKAGL